MFLQGQRGDCPCVELEHDMSDKVIISLVNDTELAEGLTIVSAGSQGCSTQIWSWFWEGL